MIKYVYCDNSGRPFSIKETEETIEKNYKCIKNEFYFDMTIIGHTCWSPGLDVCPTELYSIYQQYWELIQRKGGYQDSIMLNKLYNLFEHNLTWFHISSTDCDKVIENNIHGRISGKWRWVKHGTEWSLQLIEPD